MDSFIDKVLMGLMNIDWDGPAMFGIIFLALLALFKKWQILLLTLLTLVLGWGAQDFIITNADSNIPLINVPLLIYCIGGGVILILVIISFFKLGT